MEDSRNIIKAIDALTLKAGGEEVDSKNITEAIDNLKAVFNQEAIGIDDTLTQEGLAADAKATGNAISALNSKTNNPTITTINDLNAYLSNESSAARSLLFLNGTVTNALVERNASSIAIVAKMDTTTADMSLYSLDGNYIGIIRYNFSTSTVTKQIEVAQNSKTTVLEELLLRDGSSSGTVVATGALEYIKCHNVNSVTIAFNCSNITLQDIAYITGPNHMPANSLVPVCIRTSGSSYFVCILQQIGENELVIRSGDISSPSNPVLSFESSGRIYMYTTWVG